MSLKSANPFSPRALLLTGAALLAGTAAHAEPITVLDRNGAHVAIEAYAPNVVRVTIAETVDLAKAGPGHGVIAKADNGGFRRSADAKGDDFASAALSLHVNAQPWPGAPSQGERYFASALPPVALQIRNAKGELVLDMTGWGLAPHMVNGEKTYKAGATFHSPSDEAFYGLGQNQEGNLNLRGKTITCKHDYDAPHGESVCVPFLVSSKGYALIWDNPSTTMVYPGVNGTTAIQSNVGERVSFFVITGEKADDYYKAYADLTGRTPLPPKSAFGFIQSKARYDSQAKVEAMVDGYRQRNLPIDIAVVDWFYWTRMGQMDIDPAQFPDPDAMNRKLHSMGVETLISVWPRFEQEGRYFNFLDQKGWLLKDAEGKTQDGLPVRFDRTGGLIDSTNPEAREWFWGKIRDNIASRGFDYFWLDETEPDLVPEGMFFSIGSGDRYRNIYPLFHTTGVMEGSRRDRPDKRSLILARAAYLGAQRSGALFWSSDVQPTWEALARQVPAGLNMTASGIAYWGNDIGGWQWYPVKPAAPNAAPLVNPEGASKHVSHYPDYPELLVRWFQYGVFTPTLRVHGLRDDIELWGMGPDAEAKLSKFLKLRYNLIPYIYSAGKKTYDTGAPFMRALWMDFPHDKAVADIRDEYMFGPALLVAPVTGQGQTERQVYLPAGTDWYDYWTNEKHAGGQTVKVAAPIDQIPLFVKAGSILPWGADILNTHQKQAITAFKVYPGADGQFALYDDDGFTYAYEKGRGTTTLLKWNDATQTLTATGGDKALAKAAPGLVQIAK